MLPLMVLKKLEYPKSWASWMLLWSWRCVQVMTDHMRQRSCVAIIIWCQFGVSGTRPCTWKSIQYWLCFFLKKRARKFIWGGKISLEGGLSFVSWLSTDQSRLCYCCVALCLTWGSSTPAAGRGSEAHRWAGWRWSRDSAPERWDHLRWSSPSCGSVPDTRGPGRYRTTHYGNESRGLVTGRAETTRVTVLLVLC